MNLYKTTGRIIGIVYLAGFAVGLTGSGLIQSIIGVPNHLSMVSANSMTLTFGAILWLMAVIGSGLGLASSIPGGLWEVFMGVWLIVKGFNPNPKIINPFPNII